MKKYLLLTLPLLLSSALYADAADGKEMFEESKCMECHNIEDFSDKKMIKSKNFHEMEDMVIACQTNNDEGWFDDESHDVATYLNNEYFHLPKK